MLLWKLLKTCIFGLYWKWISYLVKWRKYELNVQTLEEMLEIVNKFLIHNMNHFEFPSSNNDCLKKILAFRHFCQIKCVHWAERLSVIVKTLEANKNRMKIKIPSEIPIYRLAFLLKFGEKCSLAAFRPLSLWKIATKHISSYYPSMLSYVNLAFSTVHVKKSCHNMNWNKETYTVYTPV